MKRFNKILPFCMLLIFALSCKEEKPSPISGEGEVPKQVMNAKVETALPGGAKIVYGLPDDPNLSYVKAVYETAQGVREVKASIYTTSLTIDCLGSVKEYSVKLYSVSRSEKESEPVVVKVTPLEPPVKTAFSSLKLTADFGGVITDFNNPGEGNIIITVIKKNNQGDWIELERYYTKNKKGQFSVSGLPAGDQVLGAFVKDVCGNQSDTLIVNRTPLAEKLLDKTKFRENMMGQWTTTSGTTAQPTVPGSDWFQWYQGNAQTRVSACWDNNIPTSTHLGTYNTQGSAPLPGSFTFDLGVTTRLSRFVYNARIDNATVIWSHSGMMDFEVWGTPAITDQKDPSFSSNGWVKLTDCKIVKPSGLPNTGESGLTNEDKALIIKGFEFRLPPNTPEVRYLRFRVLKTFNSTADWHIAELTFWGQE